MKGHCTAKVTSRQPEQGYQTTENPAKGSCGGGITSNISMARNAAGKGGGKCAGQQMLWQGEGSWLELEPTSGQKSFCSSQLGPSRQHSPTPGSLRGHRAVPWDGRPLRTGGDHPTATFPPQSCLKHSPASAFAGPTQTCSSGRDPDCELQHAWLQQGLMCRASPTGAFLAGFAAQLLCTTPAAPRGGPAVPAGVVGASVPHEPSGRTIPTPPRAARGAPCTPAPSTALLGATLSQGKL